MATEQPNGPLEGVPPGTVCLARVTGVPIGGYWSVLGLVALLAVVIARLDLPLRSPGRDIATYVVAGLVAAVLVVFSLLAHDAAHAVVARRLGLRVDGVTRGETERPDVELRMVVAGPITSGLLGAAFLGSADLVPVGLAAGVLVELGWINLMLAVFNLLPAAPLDNGPVTHAPLRARRGDRWGAAAGSVSAGPVLAATMVLGGLALSLTSAPAGTWLVVVGCWIASSAAQEGRRARLGRALDGLTVADITRPAPRILAPPRALDADAARDVVARTGGVLLREPDGRLAGFLPPESLPWASPGRMVPPRRLTLVRSQDPIVDALDGLAAPGARLVVLDAADRPIGTVTAADVLHLIAAGRPASRPPARTGRHPRDGER